MKTIETYNSQQIIRSYKLNYELSPVTNRSQLISIEECGYTGECLPPSVFEYTDNGLGFEQAQTKILPIPIEDYQHAGDEDGKGHIIKSGVLVDVNGDGFNDLVQAYKDKDGVDHLNAWLQEDGQWVESVDFMPPHVLYDYTTRLRDEERERHDRSMGQIIDVNADGLPDWVIAVATPVGEEDIFITWLNTGSGWQENASYALPIEIMNYADVYNSNRGLPSVARNSFFADLNGDGLVDVASSVRGYFDTVTSTTWMNTGSGWQIDAAYKLPGYVTDYFQANTYNTSFRHVLYGGQLIDVNRDGLPDLVRAFNSIEARLEDGTSADGDEVREVWINENPGWRLENAYEPPEAIMDYSGVRNFDLGTGAIQEVSRLQDINADGLPDWIKSHRDVNGEDQLNIWLNTGHGWIEDQNYILPDVLIDHSSKTGDDPDAWHTAQTARFLDVNSDRLVDFVQAYRDAGGADHLRTWLNTGTGWIESSNQVLPEVITDYSGYGSGNADELFSITHLQLADISGDLVADLIKSIEYSGLQQNTVTSQ